jgi:hypothetical protein
MNRQLNKWLICFSAAITTLLANTFACAYELATHARVTYKAYAASALYPTQNNTLLQNLGIDINIGSNPIDPFGATYFDVSGAKIVERSTSTFEEDFMKEDKDNPNPAIPLGTGSRSLQGWLMRGAIREDDWTGSVICSAPAPNPNEDGIDRPLNHFYDPVNDRGMIFGQRAPAWAQGTTDGPGLPTAPNTSRKNHFSVLDAKEAMFRALTLKNGSFTDLAFTATAALHDGYSTPDREHWICKTCFNDFADLFAWKVTSAA